MINAFVINLAKNRSKLDSFARRFNEFFKDRTKIQLQRFDAINGLEISHKQLIEMGYDTYRSWRDPYHNRKFTHGEIGCTLSHFGVWKKCIELNKPVIVFEDDVEFLPNFNLEDVLNILETKEFVYLSRKDIGKQPRKITDKLAVPSYSYWTCAYALTPSAAKKLCNSFAYNNILPADEYLPLMLGIHPSRELNDHFDHLPKIEPLAFEPNICKPISGAFNTSDTEIGTGTKYFKDFDLKVVTVATDLNKAKQLLTSAEKNKIQVKTLGANVDWSGGDVKNGPGGGMKVNLLRSELKNYRDDDIVMFVDGYDVIINELEEDILNRYLSFHCKVLFAAEKVCWPDRNLESQFPQPANGYRYLNSGCFIGVVSELKKIVNDSLNDTDDDQLYFQRKYLSKQFDIKLDHEGYVFQCVSMVEDKIGLNKFKQIVNSETRCTGVILHGNGGAKAKAKFDQIYSELFPPKPIGNTSFVNTKEFRVVGPEILCMKFMTPQMCADLIGLAEETARKNGGFKPLEYDKFPAQELRIKAIDMSLWNQIEKNLKEYVFPVIESYWSPTQMYGVRDLFVIRYSPDTQKSLSCHNDASMVSGTVKLNNDYTGAELYFRRQKISNIDMEVGDILLWPGQVTHGHESLPITSGTKYSLVLWTQRHPRDEI
jgi:GR25 family glycosyltransferase involved in LPS biosynthesis